MEKGAVGKHSVWVGFDAECKPVSDHGGIKVQTLISSLTGINELFFYGIWTALLVQSPGTRYDAFILDMNGCIGVSCVPCVVPRMCCRVYHINVQHGGFHSGGLHVNSDRRFPPRP